MASSIVVVEARSEPLFTRMLQELGEATRIMAAALNHLVARGRTLDSMAQNSTHLVVESEEYKLRALGVIDRRLTTHYVRLCLFDIEFRRFACTLICGMLLFTLVVLFHWWCCTSEPTIPATEAI
jgi:hypothetical protein